MCCPLAGWHGGLRSSSSAVLAPASRRHQEQHQHQQHHQHEHEHIPTLQSLRSLPAGAHTSGHPPQEGQPAIRLTKRSSLPPLRHSSAAALPQQGPVRGSHAHATSTPDGPGLSGSGSAMLSWLQKLIGRQGAQRSGFEGQADAAGSFHDKHFPGPYL